MRSVNYATGLSVEDRMIKWLREKANIAAKTAGLEEKQESTKRKIEVAMSILDRRQELERRHENIPILFDRRKHT